MRADYINPFITAATNVYSTRLSCSLERGAPSIKDGFCPEFEVSGIIEMTGNAEGTVVFSLSRTAAIGAAAALLDEDPKAFTQLNNDVLDAIGELTNLIAGDAKGQLDKLSLSIGSPNVICGKNHSVSFPKDATPISIPFDSKWGPIAIDVGLIDAPAG